VRSEKDKRYEAMNNTIKAIKNHQKISDWTSISKDFDALVKQFDSAKNVIKKEGIPKFYLKIVAGLDKSVKDTFANKASKDKLSKNNAQALNALKQKLRKHIQAHQSAFDDFLKDPANLEDKKEGGKKAAEEESDDESEEESEEESEDEKPVKKAAPAKKVVVVKKKKAASSDEESSEEESSEEESDDESEEESDDESEDESEEDSDDESDDELPQGAAMFSRDFWVKKVEAKDTTKKKDRRDQRPVAEKKVVETKAEPTRQQQELTPEVVLKRMKDIIASRGRRGTDKLQVVEDLKQLCASSATSGAIALKAKTLLCAALLDVSLTKAHMGLAHWKDCFTTLSQIMDQLASDPMVRLSEESNVSENYEDNEEEKMKKSADQVDKEPQVQHVMGSLHAFVSNLFSEQRKALQHTDAHHNDYLVWMREEQSMLQLIGRARHYYSKMGLVHLECELVTLELELRSYQYHEEDDVQRKSDGKEAPALPPADTQDVLPPFAPKSLRKPDHSLVRHLSTFLFKHGDARLKMRGLLYQVYYFAIHNKFQEARELMLLSHIQDNVQDSDIATQILFNRTMAQIGLCAFRIGEFRQALHCVSELYQNNRHRELLGQGVSTRFDRDEKQEKAEKQRQYPFHMHINLDLLEAVHLITAMFVEVPNLAMHGPSSKRRPISKTFRRLFENHQKQFFTGPPDNTRDTVMAATKALQAGDWKKCEHFIHKLKMWEQVRNADEVKQLVRKQIQEEALRTYLLTYSTQYASISLASLVSMFELSESVVHRISSKMMVNEQLAGAWDQPSACIVMQSFDMSRLQKAALRYADKTALFVEQNERLLEVRTGDNRGPRKY